MKKKYLTILIALFLLLGTGQVYAVTVLDTDIISLITDSFDSIRNHYASATDTDMHNLGKQYSDKVSQYVDSKVNQALKDVDTHKTNEVKRASQELDAYFKNLQKETNAVIDEQTKQTKESITSSVNSNIEDIKTQMNKDLEQAIRSKLKK